MLEGSAGRLWSPERRRSHRGLHAVQARPMRLAWLPLCIACTPSSTPSPPDCRRACCEDRGARRERRRARAGPGGGRAPDAPQGPERAPALGRLAARRHALVGLRAPHRADAHRPRGPVGELHAGLRAVVLHVHERRRLSWRPRAQRARARRVLLRDLPPAGDLRAGTIAAQRDPHARGARARVLPRAQGGLRPGLRRLAAAAGPSMEPAARRGGHEPEARRDRAGHALGSREHRTAVLRLVPFHGPARRLPTARGHRVWPSHAGPL